MRASGGPRRGGRSGRGCGAHTAAAPPRGRGALRALVPAVAILAVTVCKEAPGSIGRDEFVNAYVALRVAELRGSGNVIAARTRDSVLAAHGVSEDDLVTFADSHGGDPVYMAELWGAVEDSVEKYTTRADTVR